MSKQKPSQLFLVVQPTEWRAELPIEDIIAQLGAMVIERIALPGGPAVGPKDSRTLRATVENMIQVRASEGIQYAAIILVGMEGSGLGVHKTHLKLNAAYFELFFDEVHAFWLTPDDPLNYEVVK